LEGVSAVFRKKVGSLVQQAGICLTFKMTVTLTALGFKLAD